MMACEAMIVATVANATIGVMGPSRCQQIERVLDRARIRKQQRSLAEVIEQQTGQNNAEPAEADRQSAQMAHIRLHRLTAGDGEEDRAEHREPDSRRGLSQVSPGMMRADRGEDFRSAHDSKHAE